MGFSQGRHKGVAAPIIFKKKEKEKEKRKREKIEKKGGKIKKIIKNDQNPAYKWVKTDEYLRG